MSLVRAFSVKLWKQKPDWSRRREFNTYGQLLRNLTINGGEGVKAIDSNWRM